MAEAIETIMARYEGGVVKLSELVAPLGVSIAGFDVDVTGVSIDSRTTAPGEVFVALRGTAVDGHRFIGAAEDRGASAIVSEVPQETQGAVNVVVRDSSIALAVIAARFYGEPSQALRMTGITGTNGKTSTAHILKSILETSGRRTGIVGTIGHGIETLERTAHTTPDAVTLHRLLRHFKDESCFEVVMEVSSHAVRQHRVWGLDYELGILTNVTHDHLDYHKTMADYREAKAEFCRSAQTLVYWDDDPVAVDIAAPVAGAISVGTSENAEVRVTGVKASLDGTRFEIKFGSGERAEISMSLLGTFVSTNAALAAAGAEQLGVSVTDIVRGLEQAPSIPGRFDALGGSGKPVVIVDYSHTPDSMERVLTTCRELGPRQLHTVFGCGGDRDTAKRPLMGAIAEKLSDHVYVTMDNPRTEAVATINAQIVAGMTDLRSVSVNEDRSAAIASAINGADAGDVVLVLGKGHEDYQIVGDETLPFDDRAEAVAALAQWGAK